MQTQRQRPHATQPKRFRRWFPILTWGRRYNRNQFIGDLLAAGVVTLMLIPQSLAYALLPGLPPQTGLYASILPLLAYAVLGSSCTLAVGPAAADVDLLALRFLGSGSHIRSSRPHIAVVGQVPGTEHFRNVLRHPVRTSAHVLGLRIDESLYFANVRYLDGRIHLTHYQAIAKLAPESLA